MLTISSFKLSHGYRSNYDDPRHAHRSDRISQCNHSLHDDHKHPDGDLHASLVIFDFARPLPSLFWALYCKRVTGYGLHNICNWLLRLMS